jgi:hypothetical protein
MKIVADHAEELGLGQKQFEVREIAAKSEASRRPVQPRGLRWFQSN